MSHIAMALNMFEWIFNILLLTLLLEKPLTTEATGLISSSNSCNYPGDILTYECTVEGGIATAWKGSVFGLCDKSDKSLLHSRFHEINGTELKYKCGSVTTIVLQAVVSDNNTMVFTSQASVTANCKLDGLTIECYVDNGTKEIIIGSTTINVSPLPPPKHLSSTKGQDHELSFTWTQQVTNCSSTVNYYNIDSSNCGVCPKTTNSTNITCTNVAMDGSICTLTVEPEPCGTASQVTVTLEGHNHTTKSKMLSAGQISGISIAAAIILFLGFTLLIGLLIVKYTSRHLCHTSFRESVIRSYEENNLENQTTKEDELTVRTFDNETVGVYGMVMNTESTLTDTVKQKSDDYDTTLRVFDNEKMGVYGMLTDD